MTNLVRHLDIELRQRLGTKDLQIWIDHNLDGNRQLTPEIMEAIRRSATLLLIVSPSYIASEWCVRAQRLSCLCPRLCLAGPHFHCPMPRIDPLALPPEFGDLIGFKFWTRDPDNGGVTRPLGLTDLREPAYFASVIDLSDKLAQKLTELKATRAPGGHSSAVPAAEHVFLARSTDDMETREAELISYL